MKPNWWPENPYPVDIFPATVADYINAIPDPNLRSAISGCLGRLIWGFASDTIWNAVLEHIEELKEGKE